MSDEQSPIEVFYSYAQEDERLQRELEKYLSSLKRQGLISTWHNRQISPGTDRNDTIDIHLKSASVILLLVSPSFLASDYCDRVVQHALKRQQANEAKVIPILLRPVEWEKVKFAYLQPLPTNMKPITTWRDRDAAFLDVVKDIRKVVEDLRSPSIRTSQDSKDLTIPSLALSIQNIPYRQNSFFTGRDEVLKQLYLTFRSKKTKVKMQAISGLGGIGKTQIALEYAYRYQKHYRAVFWAQADSREGLVSSFVAAAQLLKLPNNDVQNQYNVVKDFKRWMETRGEWLLILDNVQDLALVTDFVPPLYGGHILLTTRIQEAGALALHIKVEPLAPELAALFLQKRATGNRLDKNIERNSEFQRTTALEIAHELGYLPLALDQAGAFMQVSSSGLGGYLNLYRQKKAVLFEEHDGVTQDHPDTIVTTWSISFKEVEAINAGAADLLRLCAFLHSDAIPEEMIKEGAIHLGLQLQAVVTDELSLNKAIITLLRYSLIDRLPNRNALNINRLVQVVLKHKMDIETYKQWAERCVRMMSAVFPVPEPSLWARCERFLPHAQACMQLIEQNHMEFPESTRLLTRIGRYLKERAHYKEAEPFVQRALTISSERSAPNHVETAHILDVLAGIYEAQARYPEAETSYLQALKIYEQQRGADDLDTSRILNNLTSLYNLQGQYGKAEPLYQRVLAISERVLGLDHYETAGCLNNLASCYGV